ncbi:Gfo/Idh/MocA family protein [Georgenia sp. Z1344]|uniref:Gfo/Idh/MocA family protein n=1 Tax=Georgenia sp. Z1344 TaxID=3416706 RepID=UPI003CEEFF82
MSIEPDDTLHPPLRAAVIGAGYWGPNLARNFAMSTEWELVAVCDTDLERAGRLARRTGQPDVVGSVGELLARDDVDAVAIATPARTHHAIAMAAIAAGKHVVVEKPLADTTARGREMVEAADRAGTVLMADHTYCYTPAVLRIKELVEAGELGEILYVDSTRINLGLVQPDVDVFWDLAPHDLSILDFVLPGGLDPLSVAAEGADPLDAGKACVGYLSLPQRSGAHVHVNVNWLSPTKIRRMVIGGSRRTLVWDDLNPQQRLSIFDRGVDLARQEEVLGDTASRTDVTISYRTGDTWSPALSEFEPLGLMVSQLAASVRDGSVPPTDGRSALRVLEVLEAASDSLAGRGRHVGLGRSVAVGAGDARAFEGVR